MGKVEGFVQPADEFCVGTIWLGWARGSPCQTCNVTTEMPQQRRALLRYMYYWPLTALYIYRMQETPSYKRFCHC